MSPFYIFFYVTAIFANVLLVGGYFVRLPCKTSANFSISIQNISLVGSVIQRLQFLELRECQAQCLLNEKCLSINYQFGGDNTCELNNMTLDYFRVVLYSLKKRNGWSFMTSDSSQRLLGTSCKKSNPCLHNEWCIETCSCPGFRCSHTQNWHEISESEFPLAVKDCDRVPSGRSGTYLLQPYGSYTSKIPVFCSFDNANQGWIVIQRRIDGTTSFDRFWSEYKSGFGDLTGNYWIGLDKLNILAGPDRAAMLKIDLRLSDNRSSLYFATYNTFIVENESLNYQLKIEGYNKNSTLQDAFNDVEVDSMKHNGRMFSTKDRDNDINPYENCAAENKGGWWYSSCRTVFLNGPFEEKSSCEFLLGSKASGGNVWYGVTMCKRDIAYCEMKIRYN